jgi:hypothetical protein
MIVVPRHEPPTCTVLNGPSAETSTDPPTPSPAVATSDASSVPESLPPISTCGVPP